MLFGDPRLPAHFWSKVRVDAQTGCWEWTASKLPAGYGRFSVNRQMTTAHRVSYAAVHGPIPAGMEIDHFSCYNRSCVNPEHLRAATKKQNQENQVSVRGRSKYRGVAWNKRHQKWHVKISQNDKTFYFGAFTDEDEAGRVAIAMRDQLYTHNDSDHTGGPNEPRAHTQAQRGTDQA